MVSGFFSRCSENKKLKAFKSLHRLHLYSFGSRYQGQKSASNYVPKVLIWQISNDVSSYSYFHILHIQNVLKCFNE